MGPEAVAGVLTRTGIWTETGEKAVRQETGTREAHQGL